MRKVRSIWQLHASEAELPPRAEVPERFSFRLNRPVQIADLPCAAGLIEATARTGQVCRAVLETRVRLRLGGLRWVECLEGTRIVRTPQLDTFTPARDFKWRGRWYAAAAEFAREGPVLHVGILARPVRYHGVEIPAGARLGEQPDWGTGPALHFEVVLTEPAVLMRHELPAGTHLLIGPPPDPTLVTPPQDICVGGHEFRANEAFLLALNGEVTRVRR